MNRHLWFGKALVAAFLLSPLGAIQARAQETPVKSPIALEVVAGKLAKGVDVAAHRKADKAVAILISKQKGFIYRETASGKNGEWFVIVHWASLKDAENAAAVFMRSEEGKVASSMLDKNSVLFMHYIREE